MRCFLAIELSKEAKEEIARVQKMIPEQGLKFIEPENLHLTLKFFGEIDDYKINKVKKALKEIKFEKIDCSLGSMGFFPSSSHVRVIWIALEPTQEIKKIQETIQKVLEQHNFKEEKKFESHITLARVKFLKDKDDFLRKVKDVKVKSVEFQVNGFSLKKSTLTKKGPIYENLFVFSFN